MNTAASVGALEKEIRCAHISGKQQLGVGSYDVQVPCFVPDDVVRSSCPVAWERPLYVDAASSDELLVSLHCECRVKNGASRWEASAIFFGTDCVPMVRIC